MTTYKYLFDIQALDLVIHGHLNLIQEEERRLSFVSSQVDKRKEAYNLNCKELADQRAQIVSLEKELFSVDEKLLKSRDHIAMATNAQQISALEKEINDLSPKKDLLEEKILTLIDQTELLEKKNSEDETYFKGVEETLKEIKEDINQVTEQNNIKVNKLEEQIKGLEQDLPKNVNADFLSSRKDNRFKDPVVLLKDQSCGKCRMQVSSVEADNINKRGDYLVCKGCSRIIVSPKSI